MSSACWKSNIKIEAPEPATREALDRQSGLAPGGGAFALTANTLTNVVGLESIGTHEALAHFAHLVFGLRFFIHFGTRRHKCNSILVSQYRTGQGRNGASQEVIKTVPANLEFAGFCRAVNYGVAERYENLIQKRIARLAEQPCTHVKGRDFAFKFKLLTNGGRNTPGRKKSHIRRPLARLGAEFTRIIPMGLSARPSNPRTNPGIPSNHGTHGCDIICQTPPLRL